MTFKRKGFMALALFSLGFLCFTFRANAVHYDGEARFGISWDIEDNAHGGTRIVFGRMHQYLESKHREDGNGLLKSTIIRICKEMNYPKTLVFDGIEYDYDEATETLSVTQIGESTYATAQQFAIAALGLNNISEMNTKAGEIHAAITKRVQEEHLERELQRGEHTARRRYEQIEAEEKAKYPLPKFVARPLKTVIIKGNVIRIGDNFCNMSDGTTDFQIITPQGCGNLSQLETVDMSQSNVTEICIGAFPGCTHLARFISPACGSLKKISYGAFQGAPIRIETLPMEHFCRDPRRPVNDPLVLCSWCTVL